MEILNFTNTKYGKTYYSTNKQWKYIKQRVKQILDEKESCKEHKINLIISLLEHYKNTYLTSKDNGKTTMFNLLSERLTEEEIIKITSNYDNKFSNLESRIEKTIEYLDTLEIHEDYDNYLQPYYIKDKQNNVLDIDYLVKNIKNILKGSDK